MEPGLTSDGLKNGRSLVQQGAIIKNERRHIACDGPTVRQ